MRKILALVVALAAVVTACSGPTATTDDPYELVRNAQSATWERVQVDIGINVTGVDEPFSIEPSALRFAVDTTAGKANVHVAFPIAALGEAASEIRALGVTGDTLEFDVIYDGEALYAKSPLGSLLAALMIQAGEIPTGDMTGWLRLLSAADIESLGSLGSGLSPIPVPDDLPIPSGADVATIQSTLEEMGITLTYAGTGSRNGVDADHVTVAVDLAKLAESEYIKGIGSAGDVDVDPSDGTISGDLWFDRGNGRIIGVDVHVASTTDTSEKADVTINIHEPDAGVSFDAPGTFVEVPLMEMISSLMSGFGAGLFEQ